jgi:hypothetical protein
VAEKHVARRHHDAAVLNRRKIDLSATAKPLPIWHNLPVDAKSSDAAIRKNPEA